MERKILFRKGVNSKHKIIDKYDDKMFEGGGYALILPFRNETKMFEKFLEKHDATTFTKNGNPRKPLRKQLYKL